jgi:hypothetical protein
VRNEHRTGSGCSGNLGRGRLLRWGTGIAIVAALTWAVVGNIQAARPTGGAPRAASTTPAIEPGVATRIDHGVAETIEANAEPDSAGASIAAYGP